MPRYNVEGAAEERKDGVAQDILGELKAGGYDTVLVGRRAAGCKDKFSKDPEKYLKEQGK
jgi:hypothetical protein